MVNVPQRYVPRNLTKKDKKKQKKQLLKSRKNYKKGKYHTRKKIASFKSKVSPHILKARKMYKLENIKPTKKLAKATKCSIKGLRDIVKKGQGAYFSSGSRPNQTGHSWGYARMASSITGGKASAVDYHILKKECKKNSKALKLAKKGMKKYKKGTRRVKKIKIGGGWSEKYKKSINCKNPKGFSQRQYCKYGRKKKKKKSTRKIRKKKGGSDDELEDPPTEPYEPGSRGRSSLRGRLSQRIDPLSGLPLHPSAVEVDPEFQARLRAAAQAQDAAVARAQEQSRQQRERRWWVRNAAGDFVESCTGHRCGLGGGKHKKTRKKGGGKPICKMISLGKGSPPFCSIVKSGIFNNKMKMKIDGMDTDFIRELNKKHKEMIIKALKMYEDYQSRPKKKHYIIASNVLKDVKGFDNLSDKDKAYMIEIIAKEIALYKLGVDYEDGIDFTEIMKKKLYNNKSKTKNKSKKKK